MRKIIKEKLSFLNPTHMEIFDDSHKHIGHSGAISGKSTHFIVIIVSDIFSGMHRIKRHKLVYDALENELKQQIHALSIKAYTQKEYQYTLNK